jgi:ribosomal protein S18 acetylase RimI-like enzyme
MGMWCIKNVGIIRNLLVASLLGMMSSSASQEVSFAQSTQTQFQQTIYIRPFEPSDYEAVVALAEENSYWLNGSAYIAELLRSQKCQIYVGMAEDMIIGFIIFDITHVEQRVGNIQYMAVKHRFRQSGCGRLLLRAALQALEEHHVEMVCLSVRSDNERAIRFYQSLGFGFMTSEDEQQQPSWTRMCRLGKNALPFVALTQMFHELLPVATP